MKRTLPLLLGALILLLATGCNRTPKLHKITGLAQGTSYHITWWSAGAVDEAGLKAAITAALAKVDKEISNYRNDSDIERFNHSTSLDWQPMPAEVIDLLAIAQNVHGNSGGCYDPTIAPLFDLWGFRSDTFRVPSRQQIEATRAHVGFDKVEIDVKNHRLRKTIPDLAIDLSSMGEGYTARRLAKVLEKFAITNYLVEFGGDMFIKGTRPDQGKWRVAIVRPLPGDLSIEKVVDINDTGGVSINTSGTYRHFFTAGGKRYSHIFDPRTGAPVTHDLVSATVFGTDPRRSDAWATAMLCLGEKEGQAIAARYSLPVFFMRQQGKKLLESRSATLKTSKAVTIQ